MSILFKFFTCFIFLTYSVSAQSSKLKFDASKPVEVLADNLTVDDIAHSGLFSGNVNIKQGDFHLSSDTVKIFYDKTKSGNKNGRIKKFIASGHVVITSPDEKVKSNKATYNLTSEKIFLEGDILLIRKEAKLSSTSATIDLKNRHIDMRSSPKKRIYSIIYLDKIKSK